MVRLPKRYGIKIDKTNSDPYNRITYIFDAVNMTPAKMNYTTMKFEYGSWEDIWFVKKNRPVMLKYDGSIEWEIRHSNHTERFLEDVGYSLPLDTPVPFTIGGDHYPSYADTLGHAGNAMSEIPLTWLYMYEEGNYEYIIACEQRYDVNYIATAHTAEDGTIKDVIYLAMYQGCSDGSRIRSISGYYPCGDKTINELTTLVKTNNPTTRSDTNGWYFRTWGQRTLINSLLLIMSKNENSQEAFGHGACDCYNSSDTTNYGMIKSGTLNTMGQFYGYNDDTHAVKVFYMENWWGNQWERLAGMSVVGSEYCISLTGPYDFARAYSIYKKIDLKTYFPNISYSNKTIAGFITNYIVTQYGRLPASFTEGSASTYLCDISYPQLPDSGSSTCATVGGSVQPIKSKDGCGMFCIYHMTHTVHNTDDGYPYYSHAWYIGASLSYV